METDRLPIACSLDGRALAARQVDLRGSVLSEAEAIDRLPDGYRWRFRGGDGLLGRLGTVIDAERHCCRFLRFAIAVDPNLGMVTLDISGPPGTADFLESWLAPPPA